MSFRVTTKILKDLNHQKFATLKQQVKGLADTEVKVGLPGNKPHKVSVKTKKGTNKKGKEDSGTTVAYIGAIHEFGAPEAGIPERPWLRPGIRAGREAFIRLNRVNLIKIIRGQMTPHTALSQLGAMAQGFVQKYIRNGEFVPLKPRTIEAKGSSKPLIDTGQMVQSVTYQVGQKEAKK